jgi:hypothetical protein
LHKPSSRHRERASTPFPFVAKSLKYSDKLIGLPFRLKCEECPREYRCGEYGPGVSSWKFEGKPIFKTEWKRCPVDYLKEPHLRIALDVLSYAKISPISGWPFDYSDWVVQFVSEIHKAIEERKAEEG